MDISASINVRLEPFVIINSFIISNYFRNEKGSLLICAGSLLFSKQETVLNYQKERERGGVEGHNYVILCTPILQWALQSYIYVG